MVRAEGAPARRLDFGEQEGTGLRSVRRRQALRLASSTSVRLRGPDKYRVLEHRRRQAQIEARRILELLD